MATEIERKFLVRDDSWRRDVVGQAILRQGYLSGRPGCTVRVRVHDERGVLTIKGPVRELRRAEYEYDIPRADAEEMLDLFCASNRIDKVRYFVRHGAHCWEVDVFEGANAPLVLAELELSDPDEPYARPSWLGEEVSDDPRYFNSYLVQHPFSTWTKD